jgi:hypothetical protein
LEIGNVFDDGLLIVGTDVDDCQNHLRSVGDFDWLVMGVLV